MIRKRLFLILSLLILIINSVFAYTVETAKAHAHYAHPETGVIEDPGNNLELGSSMSSSVLHELALFEEIDSELYVGIRYNLAEHISDVSFAVQKKGEEKFVPLDYEIVDSNDETIDFRFKLPSKDVVVRSSFFVKPMGRNTVFYFDFSDFVAGNTDFKALGEGGKMGEIISSSEILNSDSDGSININSMNSLMSTGEIGYDHGLLTKNSPQIKAINNLTSENEKTEFAESTEKKEPPLSNTSLGDISSSMLNALMIFISLMTFFFVALAIVLFLLLKYLKEQNSILEDMLYEED